MSLQASAKKKKLEQKKREEEEEEWEKDGVDEYEDHDNDTVSAEEIAAARTTRKRQQEVPDGDGDDPKEEDNLKREIQRLKMENRRLQIMTKSGRGKGPKAEASKKSAMEKEVARVSKGALWQKCKHIRGSRRQPRSSWSNLTN